MDPVMRKHKTLLTQFGGLNNCPVRNLPQRKNNPVLWH
jgi:hypothetical protein